MHSKNLIHQMAKIRELQRQIHREQWAKGTKGFGAAYRSTETVLRSTAFGSWLTRWPTNQEGWYLSCTLCFINKNWQGWTLHAPILTSLSTFFFFKWRFWFLKLDESGLQILPKEILIPKNDLEKNIQKKHYVNYCSISFFHS